MEEIEHKKKDEQEAKSEADLPYDVNMELFDKIATHLFKAGQRGENISDLYSSLNVSKPAGSRTSYLLRYFNLADSDNKKTWLTEDGMVFANSNIENKRQIIIKNVPRKYKIMLNWIKTSKENSMPTNEIKNSVIRIFKMSMSKRILDSMVTAFCNFFDYYEIAEYTKGKSSKCGLTDIGLKLLGEEIESIQKEEKPLTKEDEYLLEREKKGNKKDVFIKIISPMGVNELHAKNKEEFKKIIEKLKDLWHVIETFWPEEELKNQEEDKHEE